MSRIRLWWDVVYPLLLLAMVAIIYARAAGFAFVNYDDDGYVASNAAVRAGLTPEGLRGAFAGRQMSDWVPLTALSHAAGWAVFGDWAGGHHLVNVFLHAAASLLLYGALRRLVGSGAEGRCALVAGMFAAHPLHVESVAWVAERKDVLCAFFFMLMLWAYARYARRGGPWTYAAVALCLALGLLAKAMLITAPLALLLLDAWPLRRARLLGLGGDLAPDTASETGGEPARPMSWRRLLLEKAPLLVLAGAAFAVGLWANGPARELTERTPLGLRLENVAGSAVWYVGKTLWPTDLAALYPFPHQGLPAWQVAGAVALLLGVSALAWRAREREPWLAVGWAWFLVLLLPVSGVIMPGDFARADRYTYLPQIGLGLVLAWGGWAALQRGTAWAARHGWFAGAQSGAVARGLGGTLAAGLLLAWVALSCVQVEYWRDSGALWTHALACTSYNAVAHNGLGDFLSSQGRREEAIAQYEAALRVRPNYARAHNNWGVELLNLGRVDEAIAHFHAALALDRNYLEAWNNLGGALLGEGRLEEAVQALRAALTKESSGRTSVSSSISPSPARGTRMNLGRALLRLGRTEEALAFLEQGTQGARDGRGELEVGFALFRLGRLEEARERFAQIVAQEPWLVQGHYNLGYVQERLGQWAKARAAYADAARRAPDYALARAGLGRMELRLGEEREGLRELRRAAEQGKYEPEICRSLAWALATCRDTALRDGVEAEHWARNALALQGEPDAVSLRTLAAALAEHGAFEEARAVVTRAIEVAQTTKTPSDGPMSSEELVEALRRDLRWYEQGKALPGVER